MPTGRSIGTSVRQRSLRDGWKQRVWNGQPGGGFEGLGRSPAQDDARAAAGRVGLGNRRQQRHGVGMARGGEQGLGGPGLDDAPEIHHGDPLRDLPNHGEVVRDEEVGEPPIALQVGQQVEHLGLHRDVERRDRLVADDEAGLDRQRPRDPDALPLAAGELVRVAARVAGIEADLLEQRAPPDGPPPAPRARRWISIPSAMAAPTVIRGLRLP